MGELKFSLFAWKSTDGDLGMFYGRNNDEVYDNNVMNIQTF